MDRPSTDHTPDCRQQGGWSVASRDRTQPIVIHPMTETSDNPTIGRTETIDAHPADIFAFLTDIDTLPEYWPETTLTKNDAATGLAYTPTTEETFPSMSLAVEPQVIKTTKPTTVTISFEGDLDAIIEWQLAPTDGRTQVRVTATYTRVDVDEERPEWQGQDPLVVLRESLPATLSEMLATLTHLCEQLVPPASMTPVDIPDIYCPFPVEGINPHLEIVTANTQEWAQEMGLIDAPSSKIATYSDFAGWAYPQVSREALRLCSDWYSFGFSLDDLTDTLSPDEIHHVQKRLLAVLGGEASGPYQDPFARALADINQRASARMPASWSERFLEHHRDLLAGFRWQACHREANTVPDFHTYVRNRQNDVGGDIVIDLIEVGMNSSLPTDVHQRKRVTALREAVINTIAWTNDVYSLRRELARDDIHNHVSVVHYAHGCSLQEAVTRSCEMINAETRRFEALSDRLTVASDRDATLQAYISGLEQTIGGNLAHSKETARYGATN